MSKYEPWPTEAETIAAQNKMVRALERISGQKLTTEMEPGWRAEGDFEYAYDEIIKIAREALNR